MKDGICHPFIHHQVHLVNPLRTNHFSDRDDTNHSPNIFRRGSGASSLLTSMTFTPSAAPSSSSSSPPSAGSTTAASTTIFGAPPPVLSLLLYRALEDLLEAGLVGYGSASLSLRRPSRQGGHRRSTPPPPPPPPPHPNCDGSSSGSRSGCTTAGPTPGGATGTRRGTGTTTAAAGEEAARCSLSPSRVSALPCALPKGKEKVEGEEQDHHHHHHHNTSMARKEAHYSVSSTPIRQEVANRILFSEWIKRSSSPSSLPPTQDNRGGGGGRGEILRSAPPPPPPAGFPTLLATPFGDSAVRSCFTVDEALFIRAEFSRLQTLGLILADDLHLCYFLTPLREVSREIRWELYRDLLSRLSDERQRIMSLIGVNEHYVDQRAMGLRRVHPVIPTTAATTATNHFSSESSSSASFAAQPHHPQEQEMFQTRLLLLLSQHLQAEPQRSSSPGGTHEALGKQAKRKRRTKADRRATEKTLTEEEKKEEAKAKEGSPALVASGPRFPPPLLPPPFINTLAKARGRGGGGGLGHPPHHYHFPPSPPPLRQQQEQQQQQEQEEFIACRFFFALLLADVLAEKPMERLEREYGVSRGQVQALMHSASLFSSSMTNFCHAMEWYALEAVLGSFVKRLGFGAKPDILPLMELRSLTAGRARALWNAGYRDIASLAAVGRRDREDGTRRRRGEGGSVEAMAKKVKACGAADNLVTKYFSTKLAYRIVQEAMQLYERQKR